MIERTAFRLWSLTSWAQILALSFTKFWILGKLLNFPKSQLTHPPNEDSSCLINAHNARAGLAWYLAYHRCSIDVSSPPPDCNL